MLLSKEDREIDFLSHWIQCELRFRTTPAYTIIQHTPSLNKMSSQLTARQKEAKFRHDLPSHSRDMETGVYVRKRIYMRLLAHYIWKTNRYWAPKHMPHFSKIGWVFSRLSVSERAIKRKTEHGMCHVICQASVVGFGALLQREVEGIAEFSETARLSELPLQWHDSQKRCRS